MKLYVNLLHGCFKILNSRQTLVNRRALCQARDGTVLPGNFLYREVIITVNAKLRCDIARLPSRQLYWTKTYRPCDIQCTHAILFATKSGGGRQPIFWVGHNAISPLWQKITKPEIILGLYSLTSTLPIPIMYIL